MNQNQTLWERIRFFCVDDPSAPFKFSDKLAREQRWTPAFTSRAVQEYKRFIFLCCVSPTGASPSPVVDQVWHLHLTYTENYWKRFCAETLEREIHHHPSRGGAAEKEKHQRWYADTLRLYRETFEEDPPTDIWPPAEPVPPATPPLPDTEPLRFGSSYAQDLYLLIIPLLLPPFFGAAHPFALPGRDFLLFYGVLLAATVWYLLRVRSRKKIRIAQALAAADVQEANPFQVARFVYGHHKALETAVVDLVSKGILVADSNGELMFFPGKCDEFTLAQNPLALNLLRHHTGAQPLRMKDVHGYDNEDLTYHDGLALLYRRVTAPDAFVFLVTGGVLLLGLARMVQGLSNGYPVTYLQLLLFGWLMAAIALISALSAKKLLQQSVAEGYRQKAFSFANAEPMLARFLFLGTAALAGTYAYAHLAQTFRRENADNGTSSSASGCGSSCGSSCGGGCGGCGGGD